MPGWHYNLVLITALFSRMFVHLFVKLKSMFLFCLYILPNGQFAVPAGADWPTKHQEKRSCVIHCAFARWCMVLVSCIDSVMSEHRFCLALVLYRHVLEKLSEVEKVCDFYGCESYFHFYYLL